MLNIKLALAVLSVVAFLTEANDQKLGLQVQVALLDQTKKTPSAAEVVELAAKAYEWEVRSRVVVEGKSEGTFSQGRQPPQSNRREFRVIRSRDGDAYSVVSTGKYAVQPDQPPSQQFEMSQMSPGEGHAYWYFGSGPGTVQVARKPENVELYRRIALYSERNASSVFGGFTVGEGDPQCVTIFELLREGEALSMTGPKQAEGHECFELQTQVRGGLLRVWIAPELDYSFVGFEFVQDKPGPRFESYSAKFDHPAFTDVGDRKVLSGGRFEQRAKATNGQEYGQVVEAKCTEFDLKPNFEPGLFVGATIPEGTDVKFADAPGESGFKWVDGKPERERE